MRKLLLNVIAVFSIATLSSKVVAQSCAPLTMCGPATANVGDTDTYTVTDDGIYNPYTFTAVGGSVNSVSRSGSTYTVVVAWTDVGQGSITFDQGGETLAVTVSTTCFAPTTPSATFTYANNCGNTVITRSGTIPSGVAWYWQTSSTGTSTSYSTATYTVSTSGTYYLRSFRDCGSAGSTWGGAKATSAVTVKTVPTVSATNQTVCSATGTSIILTNNLASTLNTWTVNPADVSGVSGYSNSSGTSGTSSPYTYTLAQTLNATTNVAGTVKYTITPSNNGCTGTAIQVTATVNPLPLITATGDNQTICSGSQTAITMTNTNNVSGTTFSWTVSSTNVTGAINGTNNITGSIAQTPSATTSSPGLVTYSIKGNANGCPGPFVTVRVNVNPTPVQPATPLISANACGPKTLSYNGAPASGVSWYWQGQTSSGLDYTSSTATASTYSASANGSIVYYIKSRNTYACWSAATAVTPAVTLIPDVSASTSNVFSEQTTNISISNPNNLSGTVFNWTVSPTNVIGSSGGSGSSIAQKLTNTTSNAGSVVYTITPVYNGCSGTPIPNTVNVYPTPVISAPQTYIVQGTAVTLDAGAGYDSYLWKNGVGTIVGAAQTFSTKIPDNYTVTLGKSTARITPPAIPIYLQFSGMNANYIVTRTAMVENLTDSTSINNLGIDTVNQSIAYFDGIGRPLQMVITQGSPLKKDMVSPVYYDNIGRESRKYLPVVLESNGRIKNNLFDAASNYTSGQVYSNDALGKDKITDDVRPFSETFFDGSPLNLPVQDFGPGNDWKVNNKYVQHDYQVNQDGTGSGYEKIIAWTISSGLPIRSLLSNSNVSGGCFTSGQLMITSTVDEQGHAVREYKDMKGRIILKKVQAVDVLPVLNDPTHWTQTYYIYDDMDMLRFVLQPELVKNLVQNNSNPTAVDLNNFAFQYQYDARQRLVQKQLPGAGPTYLVYDSRNRLVMTQDANQRANNNNKWLYTKYDAFNRPVITGIYTHTTTLDQPGMTTLVSANTTFFESRDNSQTHGYTNTVFNPTNFPGTFQVLTVSYYDDYSFKSMTDWGASYNYASTEIAVDNTNHVPGQAATESKYVSGHPTGSKVNVLGTSTYLKSVAYYDAKYRTIQTIADNNKGGTDISTNVIDFTGRVLRAKTTHKTSTHNDQTIVRRIIYDHVSRVKQVFHTVNANGEKLLAQNTYNELGQVVDKGLYSTDNGATVKQSVDYRYNIRGWLTSMNNSQLTDDHTGNNTNDDITDLFGFELGYNNNIGTGNANLYNGNISAMKWSSNMALGTVKDVGYNYSYDALNRITGASYLMNTSGAWSNANNAFSESSYSYDMNGNIKTLIRNGGAGTAIDNMTYTYNNTNQLKGISDAADKTNGFMDGANTGDDYTYDVNGNMVSDQNKGLTAGNAIQYNHLNLPIVVTKSTNEKIVYTYDAAGRKLMQQVFNADATLRKTMEYNGEFIYSYFNGSGGGPYDTLQFINHEEGRITMKLAPGQPNTTALNEYQFHLRDHLGNVRVTFTSTPMADSNTGGYETANSSAEQSKFLRYANARRINATMFDHTNGNSPGYSERLNGSANEKYGLARSISVMPGDVISTEVYAKYVDTNSSNWNSTLTSLMSQIAANTAGVVVDGASYSSSTSSFPAGFGTKLTKTDDGAPKAYLNWLVFDRNYVLDVTKSGFKQITTVCRETGTDVPHEYLSSGNITISQPGYVYIYLSNESTSLVEVYFDDFNVKQSNTIPVVQQADYYPFGLTFNSYSRENIVPQNFLYNGKEQINDLAIDWYDYGARMYMPEIGRWGVVDPLAETSRRYSPYTYAFDNPIRYIDPDGMEGEDVMVSNGISTFSSRAAGYSVELSGNYESESGRQTSKGTGITVDRKRFDKDNRQLKAISFRKAVRVELTVTIHNAKVLDNSSGDGSRKATDEEVKEAGQTMAEEIEKTWSGTYPENGREIKTNVNFEGGISVIHNEDEAESSDFLMKIVDDGSLGKYDGLTNGNHISVAASYAYLKEIMNRNDIGEKGPVPLNDSFYKVPSHETGHVGGLPDRHGSTRSIMNKGIAPPSFKDRWNLFRGR